MTVSFEELGLRPELMQAIAELGYTEPTPIQSSIIPIMLSGSDVIGQAQTGTGKTAAFALPILQKLEPRKNCVQALIMTPTRELAIQVANAFNEYGQFRRINVLPIYGGASYGLQLRSLRNGVDVVVGTPGRLMDLMKRKALLLDQVHTVVLDEADEMLSMGFVEDIETILSETPDTRQTTLFSATMPTPIRRLADKYLNNPQSVTIQHKQMTVEAIEQRYYLVNEKDKSAVLTRLFEVEDITSALIFCRTRAGSGELANELNVRGFPAEVLNGDLTQDNRERVLNRFRQNRVTVLVATDVAARGLDIDDISHVFNFDLPEDEEIYVHRIGRTGRAGKTGIAISLITPSEQWRLRRLEAFTKTKLTRANIPSEEEIKGFRENQIVKQMNVWLGRGRFKREKEIVEQLIAEGHDILDIAAAAMKMARGEEKQRPIAAISQVSENPPARKQDRNARRPMREARESRSMMARKPIANTSHESGMTRLMLDKGRQHGVRPSEVVSTIAFHAEIPGRSIGKIHIRDQQTLVDVPEQFVSQVLAQSNKFRLCQQPIHVEVSKN